MLLKSTTYSHGNDLCSSRDTTISIRYPRIGLRLRMLCNDAELTDINQKIIISLQENKRLIRRATMACSAAITMLFCARVYQSNVSNENPDSVNFPVDGFQRRRIPGCRSARNKEKTQRGTLSVVEGRAEFTLDCPLIREPLRDVCRIIVD